MEVLEEGVEGEGEEIGGEEGDEEEGLGDVDGVRDEEGRMWGSWRDAGGMISDELSKAGWGACIMGES